MSDWNYLNSKRVPPTHDRLYGSTPEDGFNGLFFLEINGLPLTVICSDGEGWQHVSVSVSGRPHVTPSWSIMCQIKDLFWEDDQVVVQFHPKKSDHVNIHPGCLHLWRCLDKEFPTPDRLLVGPKDENDLQRLNNKINNT